MIPCESCAWQGVETPAEYKGNFAGNKLAVCSRCAQELDYICRFADFVFRSDLQESDCDDPAVMQEFVARFHNEQKKNAN